MPLDTNSIIETVASFLDGPELAEVVHHHFVQTPGSAEPVIALGAIAAHLVTLWEAFATDCTCASTQFVGVSCRVLPPGAGSGFLISNYSTMTGSVTGECVGAQECALLSKYSADSSRRGRGRAYLPFVPEEFVVSGRLTVTAKGMYESQLAPIFLDEQTFSGITIDPCIFSRSDNAYKEITFTLLRSVTTTQRRRLRPKQAFAS